MFGLAAALSLLALVRHRKLLWVLAAGALLVLVLPMTRDYVQHFVEGLRGQDLATQMRFGEYKDALLLISRYPWFGVGFTGVPDVDIYLGVSNLYLLIAEEMGLVGVSVFLLTMLTYFLHVWPASRLIRGVDSELESMLLGTLTAVAAGLVAGVLDHYLFNLTFPHAATLLWLVVALGVGVLSRQGTVREDTAIGILFSAALSLGVVLISSIRSYAVDLNHILFGDVLSVGASDLWLTAGLGLLVLLAVAVLYRALLVYSFDPVFASTLGVRTELLRITLLVLLALTIVVSLRTVGVGLVAAMLVTPAATAYLLVRRLAAMMAVAAGVGLAGSLIGLYVSYYANVSSGAAIVLTATVLFFVAFLLSPRHGPVRRLTSGRRS